MRKDFTFENSLEKEVVFTIRVPKDFDENMVRRIDEAFSDILFDLGCELVNSEEYRDVSVPDLQHVDTDMLRFRDYDDTGEPLQFFYGLEVPKEQLQALASFWGYKGALCKDIAICLDLYSLEECPVEAILTFEDNEQRWVDLRHKSDYLGKFVSLVEEAGTERAKKALELLTDLDSNFMQAVFFTKERADLDFEINIDKDKITDSARISVTWDSYGIAVDFNYSYDEALGYGESVLCFAEPYDDGAPDESAWVEAQRIGHLLKEKYVLPLDISKDDRFLHQANNYEIIDSFSVDAEHLIYSVSLAPGFMIDVKVNSDTGLVYVMQNADGSYVYSKGDHDATYPDYSFNENLVVSFIKDIHSKQQNSLVKPSLSLQIQSASARADNKATTPTSKKKEHTKEF